MRIGIYIGSFNPPHIGHKKVANYLIENNHIDKVIIIPTGNYWDKQNLADIKDRINMLKYYENKDISVDTTHNDIKYTYQLLDTLSKIYINDELYLIIGADNIIDLDKWKNIYKILEYKIIVVNRDNIDINSYINKFENIDNFYITDTFPNIYISSTKIRNIIKENKDNELDKYMDKKVLKYIRKKGLYS